MQGKELLKYFKNLPENEQNKILVEAFGRIAKLHDSGSSLVPFDWTDCRLDGNALIINAATEATQDQDSIRRNLSDYAKVVYCLSTGSKSAESMSWDAGRKIHSAVLREIVLTICGRNESVEPLLKKLRQPYVDSDTFFENYSTVDEKEGREAYEKQKRIDADNRAEEASSNSTNTPSSGSSWGSKIVLFIIIIAGVGGYQIYKHTEEVEKRQAVEATRKAIEEHRQMRDTLRKYSVDFKSGKAIRSTSKDTATVSDQE